MEFTNEIFFNKPLTAGSTVIITYCGKLYREHSKDVSIVFGYGDNWNETDNSPMIETENGFEVTLTIKDYNTFNFCFTNSFNIWDNNFGFNYISPIEPKQEETIIEENQVNEKEEITDDNNQDDNNNNDNTPKDNSLGENTEISSSSITIESEEETNEKNEEENSSDTSNTSDTSDKFENTNQDENIEAVFASLLDSILNDKNNNNETIDIFNLSGFGLQSVDEIKEEDMINCDDIFAELFEELTFDSKNQNIVLSESPKESKVLEETSTNIEKAEITNYDNYDVQELDNLMDNLLLSISNNDSETSEYATPVQTIKNQNLSNENVGLPATLDNTDDWVDKIISFSYSFSKKVTTAFKKLGSLIKLKAKEIGIINEDK